MKFGDILHYSYVNMRHRQTRFWLTILGIVIGIASVVALLTIGEAFSRQVDSELASFNANTVYVVPISEQAMQSGGLGSAFIPTSGKLTDKDVERLRRIPEITDIARVAERRASVEFKGIGITATVSGIEPEVFEKLTALEVEKGRFLQDTDRHAVGLGADAAEKAFGIDKKVEVNSYLLINGVKYRVIGVLKKTGGGFGTDIDNGFFVHFEDSREIFNDTLAKGEMDSIALSVQEGSDMDAVVEKIKAEMDASHKVRPDERDYSVIDPKFISQSVGGILSMVTIFLGAIAGISLVVGGLAIASSMFTSVIERTQEIGILKAIGASEQDILRIFIIEAGSLGAIGGLVGTALGLGVVWLGSLFGLPAQLSPAIAVFGVLFAFAVGLASGYFPARQAAKLSPVDALRQEH